MRGVVGLLIILCVVITFTGFDCTTRSYEDTTKKDDESVDKEDVITGEIVPVYDEDIENLDDTEFVVEGTVGEGEGGETPVYTNLTDTTKTNPSGYYRVQVIAVTTKTGADKVAEEVRIKLPGEKVYVEQIGEYWKVRVGDCSTRSSAETLRDKLRSLGYSDAWIVAP
ncbi:MAG: SPOR domain-containing protein [bacterium]